MKKLKTDTLHICFVLAAAICLIGCTKNDSKFYKDGEEDGLVIFSNTGNNVMTCYINGEPWHTIPRITTTTFFSSSTSYEVSFYRTPINNTSESVQISWQGNYQNNNNNPYSYVGLRLLIPRNSFVRYLSGLQGQRIRIDSSAGNYFTATIGQAAIDNKKANGNIYFHTIQIDSVATGIYTGKMSGIFEANFGSGTITKGRFDHVLTQEQIR